MYEIDKTTFRVFILTSFAAAIVLSVAVMTWEPAVLALVPIPPALWAGLAFLVLFVALYPVISTWQRSRGGPRISFLGYLGWSTLGALVGALVFHLL